MERKPATLTEEHHSLIKKEAEKLGKQFQKLLDELIDLALRIKRIK